MQKGIVLALMAVAALLAVATAGVDAAPAMTAEAKTMAGEFVDVADEPATEETAGAPAAPEVDITEVPILANNDAPAAEAAAAAPKAEEEAAAPVEEAAAPVEAAAAPADITEQPVGTGNSAPTTVPTTVVDEPVHVAEEPAAAPKDVTEVPVSAEAPVVDEAAADEAAAEEAAAESNAAPAKEGKGVAVDVTSVDETDADVHVVEPHGEEAAAETRKVPGDDTLTVVEDASGVQAPTVGEAAGAPHNTTAGEGVTAEPVAGGKHGGAAKTTLEKLHQDNIHALKAISNMIKHEEELVRDDGSNVLGGFAGADTRGSVRFTGDKTSGPCLWELHAIEEYSNGAHGWSNNEVSKCAHRQLLGGYNRFSGGEVYKVFEDLPTHTHLRVRALWHFIDNWDHDSVFLKVDEHYAYTKAGPAAHLGGLNVCGADGVADQINHLMDVSIFHDEDCAKVSLGSNLQGDASHAAWGVSSLSVWTCKVHYAEPCKACAVAGNKEKDGGEIHTQAVTVDQPATNDDELTYNDPFWDDDFADFDFDEEWEKWDEEEDEDEDEEHEENKSAF